MDPYQETFNTWDKVSGLYQDKFMDLDIYNESYDLFCALIDKRTARILDLGCGPGNITRYLLNKSPEYDILGLDISPNMIHLASQNNPSAHFQVMDLRNLDQLEGSCDAIIAGFSLPYLAHADGEQMIQQCSRLLNPGGFFYISYVPGDPESSGFISGSTGDRTCFYYYEEQMIEIICLNNSLHIISKFNYPFTKSDKSEEDHCIVVLRKI